MSTKAFYLEEPLEATTVYHPLYQQLVLPSLAFWLNYDVDSEQSFYELYDLGQTLESDDQLRRFAGVRQDLVRELAGGMCTLDQALAYLENFELQLLKEAETIKA